MKTPMNTFLAELYEIDPGLRAHEADIIPLIDKLLKNDPATSPDPAFVAQLRTQLRERAHTMNEAPAAGFTWSNVLYGLSGALAVLVILPVMYLGWTNGKNDATETMSDGALFGYSVEEAGDNAFGPLKGITPGAGGARNQSGGGGMGGDAAVTNPAPMAAEGSAAMDYGTTDIDSTGLTTGKMIAPGPMYQYEYVYDGELTGLADTVSVYKRDPSGSTIPMSALASRLNLGTINLESFRNMNVESVSFSQNVPYGYQMYVNLRDGTLGINAQWDQWPQSKCQTEACYRAQQVKIGDIPADDQLIAIARSFVGEHGVDLSQYGEPEVDNAWRVQYEAAPDKSTMYVPETMRVVFPLLIDGKPAYDQGGAKNGISVGVQVKEKKVMDVWGISNRTYLKSDYAGVTDAALIKSFINKTDKWAMDPMPRAGGTEVRTGKVILGEPTLAHAMYYSYKDNLSSSR